MSFNVIVKKMESYRSVPVEDLKEFNMEPWLFNAYYDETVPGNVVVCGEFCSVSWKVRNWSQ